MSTNEFSRPARERLASIHHLTVTLNVFAGEVHMAYEIFPLAADGSGLAPIKGDLRAKITAQQETTIEQFMTSLWTRAESALIEPVP